jgi:hypothetical protein
LSLGLDRVGRVVRLGFGFEWRRCDRERPVDEMRRRCRFLEAQRRGTQRNEIRFRLGNDRPRPGTDDHQKRDEQQCQARPCLARTDRCGRWFALIH